MGLSLAAFTAGKIPARIPTSILKPKATVIAVTVTIGSFSVGENELSMWTKAKEAANPAKPPRTAITTDSTRI